jgi:hypothetical protein
MLSPFKSYIKDKHIIQAYGVINIAATTLVALFWCKIAAELKIGPAGKWLGFGGLILNFAMTKSAFFNPVLTDVTAMAISTAMSLLSARLAVPAALHQILGGLPGRR